MTTLHQEMSTNLAKVLPVDIELIKEAVRRVLDERGIYQTPPQSISKREWHDTTDAYQLIGLNTSNPQKEKRSLTGHANKNKTI